jgi:Cu-Zn family superoxide dismutase
MNSSFLSGCGVISGLLLAVLTLNAAEPAASGQAGVGSTAVAVLVAGGTSGVSGTVKFTQEAGGVRVEAEVRGLTPGSHGFHVHEKGDLSAPTLVSAGGHFNPGAHAHGAPNADVRHVGDLGNLVAGADGRATLSMVDPRIQLAGPHSIIGRAVIVHEKADDLRTQPTGDAGARVAGGVIGIVELK